MRAPRRPKSATGTVAARAAVRASACLLPLRVAAAAASAAAVAAMDRHHRLARAWVRARTAQGTAPMGTCPSGSTRRRVTALLSSYRACEDRELLLASTLALETSGVHSPFMWNAQQDPEVSDRESLKCQLLDNTRHHNAATSHGHRRHRQRDPHPDSARLHVPQLHSVGPCSCRRNRSSRRRGRRRRSSSRGGQRHLSVATHAR